VSANRYWRPVRIGQHITIVPTKEAKAYRVDVARSAPPRAPRAAHRPHRDRRAPVPRTGRKDFASRMRKQGPAWDDSVQCIDLDNANKVLLDALKGIAFEDDRWVRRLQAERMEPDEKGARVVVFVRKLAAPVAQGDLLHAA
jgi:crossover junction endodeoxyribonuclease RusA